jgi:hypothetical protein
MHLFCPTCNAPIAADDMDLPRGLAKCRACQAVFRFDDDPLLTGAEKPRMPTPRPEGVVASQGAGELRFVRRWFTAKYVFLTFFAVFWDGFLAVWYYMAFRLPGSPLMVKLFPLLHVGVGTVLTYAVIAGWLNRTVVEVGPGHLGVRHGPVPWPGNLDLPTGGLKQLFCERRANRGRYGITYTYDLVAVLADGSRRKLLTGLDQPDVPRYLEEQMEKYLRITDMAVTGEYRG